MIFGCCDNRPVDQVVDFNCRSASFLRLVQSRNQTTLMTDYGDVGVLYLLDRSVTPRLGTNGRGDEPATLSEALDNVGFNPMICSCVQVRVSSSCSTLAGQRAELEYRLPKCAALPCYGWSDLQDRPRDPRREEQSQRSSSQSCEKVK